jgi:two-component system sensor histidine kinase AlgZ
VPKDALVPMLSLQPLIENAIYHGIQPLPEGGEITVEATLVENTIQIHISNPMPTHHSKPHTKGNQMALGNIEHRLALIFGKAATIKLTPKSNQFDVGKLKN